MIVAYNIATACPQPRKSQPCAAELLLSARLENIHTTNDSLMDAFALRS